MILKQHKGSEARSKVRCRCSNKMRNKREGVVVLLVAVMRMTSIRMMHGGTCQIDKRHWEWNCCRRREFAFSPLLTLSSLSYYHFFLSNKGERKKRAKLIVTGKAAPKDDDNDDDNNDGRYAKTKNKTAVEHNGMKNGFYVDYYVYLFIFSPCSVLFSFFPRTRPFRLPMYVVPVPEVIN